LLYVQDKEIWLHNGNDSAPLKIDGVARDPAWSPDSQRIAYIRREESFADLYLFDVESGKSIQVTHNGSQLPVRTQDYVHQIIWAAKPTWRPDGQELVYLSQTQPSTRDGDQPAIYEYPLSMFRYKIKLLGTREPTNDDLLTVGQGDDDIVSPAWSPDGRYVAYVDAPRNNTSRQLMVYDFTTEQAQRYPGVPDGAYDPAWSPDGSMLAFAVNQDGATDVWAIPSPQNPGTPIRITKIGHARLPVWSPAGNLIAFLNIGDSNTDLFVVTLTSQNGRIAPGAAEAVTQGADIDATGGMSWTK
jgi:TolB protein